ncbi:SGNH/GDSL hydrolase family protein [Lactobacillus sp. CC-MHH1034]|nr:SGNH/GDSL hydrolase family protein [Agrilactobacillus fermenti]
MFGVTSIILLLVACQKTASESSHNHESSSQVRHQSAVKTPTKQRRHTAGNQKNSNTIISKLKRQTKTQLKYVAFGDSLTVGLFADTEPQDFAHQFANQLQKETGKTIQLTKVAQVGKTVANLALPQVRSVIAQQPDVVTIEFGTNDAVGGTDAATLDRFRADLTAVVEQLQQGTQAQLILMTTWSPANGPYVANDQAFDTQIKAVAATHHVPVVDMHQIWGTDTSVTGPSGKRIPDFAQWGPRDNFHPNQTGHDLIARQLAQIIQQ